LATGVPVIVPAPGPMHGNADPATFLKPEPAKFTCIPEAPEVGERTILGLTVTEAAAESPPGFPVTVTVTAAPVNTEFAPILNFAESWPKLFTVQAGSPLVSIISEADAEVIVQVVSAVEKPVPATVISVPVAVGGPMIGGNPLVGLNVTAGVTMKPATADLSPCRGVTVTL